MDIYLPRGRQPGDDSSRLPPCPLTTAGGPSPLQGRRRCRALPPVRARSRTSHRSAEHRTHGCRSWSNKVSCSDYEQNSQPAGGGRIVDAVADAVAGAGGDLPLPVSRRLAGHGEGGIKQGRSARRCRSRKQPGLPWEARAFQMSVETEDRIRHQTVAERPPRRGRGAHAEAAPPSRRRKSEHAGRSPRPPAGHLPRRHLLLTGSCLSGAELTPVETGCPARRPRETKPDQSTPGRDEKPASGAASHNGSRTAPSGSWDSRSSTAGTRRRPPFPAA